MTAPAELFAVLGDPIAHSRSPRMHEAAFAVLGLPHRYAPLRVAAADLPAALAGMRALGLRGVNLTVPHKRAALGLVDEVDAVARRVGAINTVTRDRDRDRDRLVGTNTDVGGFADALAELDPTPPRRAVVLGGGGASRAIVVALLDAGAEVAWVSRDPAAIAAIPDGAPRCVGWPELDAVMEGADVLVNATTVGMAGGPTAFPCALPLASLHASARVVDAVYPRPAGGLLDHADAAGHVTQDGRAMLLWQGVRALSHWLGRDVPAPAVAAMRAALR